MTLTKIDNKLPINLIWQTFNGDQTNFEFEYTTEVLFKNFERLKTKIFKKFSNFQSIFALYMY